MSDDNRISLEEQRALGVRRGNANFVPAQPARQLPSVRPMSEAESAALTGLTQAPTIQLPEFDGTHTGYVRHIDDPVTNARATIDYGHVIGAWAAVIVSALLFYGYIHGQVSEGDYIPVQAAIIGVCMLVSLVINRAQGLHHSATGISHAETKSKERMYKYGVDSQTQIAMHAIDKHAELIEKRWKLTGGDDRDA